MVREILTTIAFVLVVGSQLFWLIFTNKSMPQVQEPQVDASQRLSEDS